MSRPDAVLAAALSACLVLSAAHAHAGGERTRYFELVNASHDSVTALAAAPAGSGAYAPLALGVPLRGGTRAVTVELPGGACRYDLRVGFGDGRTLLYPGIDACRHPGLRLRPGDGRTTATR
ncbi:hypothetical protein LDO32_00570 [Luteimonas sp. Y-2-2-4F]|nr:hypothetical protein [Luteimonas sp. Y-2-2-4F]MCD9030229.1 hypothetical protein [Luteimonas sp. Y-2-2-4F]